MKTLISIDGGGVWGAGVARYMNLLAQYLNGRIPFDAVAGTSTGAIIASLMAIGMEPAKIQKVFQEEASGMFQLPPFYKRIPGRASTYVNDGAVRLLKKHLGERRIRDTVVPIWITATNITTQEEVVFSWAYNQETPLWKAVLCSISAPSFFPPVNLNGDELVDGGLVANDPSIIGAPGMIKLLGIDANDVKILSFATSGRTFIRNTSSVWNVAQWLGKLKPLWTKGNMRATGFAMKRYHRSYLRLMPEVIGSDDCGLDDVKHIPRIIQIWEKCFQETKEETVTFLKGA